MEQVSCLAYASDHVEVTFIAPFIDEAVARGADAPKHRSVWMELRLPSNVKVKPSGSVGALILGRAPWRDAKGVAGVQRAGMLVAWCAATLLLAWGNIALVRASIDAYVQIGSPSAWSSLY